MGSGQPTAGEPGPLFAASTKPQFQLYRLDNSGPLPICFAEVETSHWPSLKEVASVVVQVMNDRVPEMSMYRDRQNGWPMTIEDILQQSNQRIHADARHLVTLIMLDHVLEENGVERKRIPKRKLARVMNRHERTVRNSEMVGRYLIETVPEYSQAFTSIKNVLKAAGYTVIESSNAPALNPSQGEQRP